jgi:SAM-dependent methyltransferase
VTTTPTCPYCCSSASTRGRDGVMMQCVACKARYVFPMPTADALAAYYSGQTVNGMRPELRNERDGTSQRSAYASVAQSVLGAWARHVSSSREPRSIADVGAGALELTDAFLEATTATAITAFDIDAGRRPHAASGRLQLRSIDLNRIDEASADRFDVVACVAVLEHVIDPCSLLQFLGRLTNANGIVYALVPDNESLAGLITGRRWPYYCPDEHLTIPTRRALESLVARCGGGEAFVRSFSMPYSVEYILRYLGLRKRLPRMLDVVVPLPTGVLELVWKPAPNA